MDLGSGERGNPQAVVFETRIATIAWGVITIEIVATRDEAPFAWRTQDRQRQAAARARRPVLLAGQWLAPPESVGFTPPCRWADLMALRASGLIPTCMSQAVGERPTVRMVIDDRYVALRLGVGATAVPYCAEDLHPQETQRDRCCRDRPRTSPPTAGRSPHGPHTDRDSQGIQWSAPTALAPARLAAPGRRAHPGGCRRVGRCCGPGRGAAGRGDRAYRRGSARDAA